MTGLARIGRALVALVLGPLMVWQAMVWSGVEFYMLPPPAGVAIAPLLVLWLGFGIVPKIVVVALIVYFPVTAAFFDGLRRTDPGWLDLAHVMNGSRWTLLRHVRVPAAMPALASGLRIATALAPNAAIIGEWVGASSGLGYLMLHDNARTETPRMFASLFVLAVFAVALYFTVDFLLRRLIAWQAETLPSEE